MANYVNVKTLNVGNVQRNFGGPLHLFENKKIFSVLTIVQMNFRIVLKLYINVQIALKNFYLILIEQIKRVRPFTDFVVESVKIARSALTEGVQNLLHIIKMVNILIVRGHLYIIPMNALIVDGRNIQKF